jgi:hypothetical protein
LPEAISSDGGPNDRGKTMNDAELKRFRDYANHYKGSDVDLLVEHIDELDRDVLKAHHRYADLQQVCDDQDKRITLEAGYLSRLEAAYIEDSMQSEELAKAALEKIRSGKELSV